MKFNLPWPGREIMVNPKLKDCWFAYQMLIMSMLDDDCTKLTKHKAKGLSHPKSTEDALLEGNLFVTKSTCHTYN